MRKRALRSIVPVLAGLAIGAAALGVAAQEPGWKSFTSEALGLTIQRPADLYELEPEAPSEDVTGEVEWGPEDHSWSIIITSHKLKPGQSLATVAAEEKQRNPRAEAREVKIGDGVEAVRMWVHDDDALSTFVLMLDKTRTKIVAIELAISLGEEDAGKSLESLRISYSGTLALFERMLGTVRMARN